MSNFEKLKLVHCKTEGGEMISIQEDFGQEDDPELAIAGIWNPTSKPTAYAKLFAAAPELLEALQFTVTILEGLGMTGAVIEARKAIAKALGEEE